MATGTTVESMRTVRARSTRRAAALVTSRAFIRASVAGVMRPIVAASADFDGEAATALIRQKVRYVAESAR